MLEKGADEDVISLTSSPRRLIFEEPPQQNRSMYDREHDGPKHEFPCELAHEMKPGSDREKNVEYHA